MLILAIETSCDETAAAILENGTKVLSSVVASQTEFHRKYGGIVPEIASRKHIEAINPVIAEALEKAGKKFNDLDAVAVTYGPGLVGSLLVGLCAAKAIAWSLKKPLIGVNHLEGHIYANFLAPSSQPLVPQFPFICLIVSGGHTLIVEVKDHGKYKVLGRTRDDAAGEAFDKVARFLNLGYPGGPIIDKLAKEGNPHAVEFKRPMLARRSSKSEGGIEKEFGYDFSFSGIKTAVVNYVTRVATPATIPPTPPINALRIPDIVASFQQAVVETLVEKTIQAAVHHKIKTVALAGGVSANSALRKHLTERGGGEGLRVLIPPLEYTTDNAAMIACAGYYKSISGDLSALDLKPVASLKL